MEKNEAGGSLVTVIGITVMIGSMWNYLHIRKLQTHHHRLNIMTIICRQVCITFLFSMPKTAEKFFATLKGGRGRPNNRVRSKSEACPTEFNRPNSTE